MAQVVEGGPLGEALDRSDLPRPDLRPPVPIHWGSGCGREDQTFGATTEDSDQSAIDPTSPQHDDGLVTWTDAQVRLNSERQFSGSPEETVDDSEND